MAAFNHQTCRRCHTPKTLDKFTPDSTYKHGRRQVCQDCETHPDAEAYRKWRETSLKRTKFCSDHGEYSGRYCGKCRADYMRVYTQQNREKANARRIASYHKDKHTPGWKEHHYAKNRAGQARLRDKCFEAYGGKCYCCGLDDWRFLTIDHVWNDGHNHKYPNGKRRSGTVVYKEALAEMDSGRFRIACFNCNCARAMRGKDGLCPHELDRLAKDGEAA